MRICIASRRYEISYPDGSRKKVSAVRFALMGDELQHITANQYAFVGQARTFHTFVDFAQWHTVNMLNPEVSRTYLERLRLIFEQAGGREYEWEETDRAFEQRLVAMGMPTTGFEQAVATQ